MENKTAVILADLAATDSTTRADAVDAIGDTKFDVTDLPLLYQAYLKQYPIDTAEYY